MRVREVTFDDWEEITTVARRTFGMSALPARSPDVMAQEAAAFRRRWAEHPHASRFAGVPIGWLLEDDEGRGVGTFTNRWAAYSFRGEFLRAGVASAWGVDPSHRGAPALSLLDAYMRQKNVELLVDTTANPVASAAMLAFKAKRMPLPDLDVCTFWVLQHGPFLRSASLGTSRPLPLALCKAIGLPMDLALHAARSFMVRPSGLRIEHLASFDARFDRFWDDLQAAYPDRLLAYRDAASLTHHFGPRLDAGTVTIVTMSTGGRMLGYTVLLMEEAPHRELRRARLADIQYVDVDSSAITALVTESWRLARDRGAAVLEIFALSPEKRKALSSLWPLKRKFPTWPYVYKAKTEPLAKALADGRAWDPSAYDGDSSL